MTSPVLLASYYSVAVMRTEHQVSSSSTETIFLVQLRKITYKTNHEVALSITGLL
jgi:hypothetical protein